MPFSAQPSTYETKVAETKTVFIGHLGNAISRSHLLVTSGAILFLLTLVPLAVLLMQSLLILAFSGLLILGGIAAWKMLPYLVLRLENAQREYINAEMNRHLQALKAEARENPIEQLQNEHLRRAGQADAFKKALITVNARIDSYADMLKASKKERPNSDFSREEAALAKMVAFYTAQETRYNTANAALENFKEKIREAELRWNLQKAANSAMAAMDTSTRDEIMGKILSDVAFNEVQDQFNMAFSALDMSTAELNSKQSLSFDGFKLDISDVKVGAPVLVQ